jgi:putative alpha-1,2-mannosidase
LRVELTSPLFDKVTIHLDKKFYKGEKFTIRTGNNSGENLYVQNAFLNGKPLKEMNISFKDIVNGGELFLEMGNNPAVVSNND